jgi:tetratricopeptide (TPR) repeat protein
VFWKGDIHNYLSLSEPANKYDIKITAGYSKAHKNDPDRALRILKKVVGENPKTVREVYYLAREYWYRKDYITAIYWYKDYLSRATWMPEVADAYLMMARCYWSLRQGEEARKACLQAISINANFREALLFMAEISWLKNKKLWLQFADLANNEDVLFVRAPSVVRNEKSSAFYDKAYTASKDMSRYHNIYKAIADMAADDERVVDVGCGTADLQKFIKNYLGFDFSEVAVKIANTPKVRVADAYDPKNFVDGDTYVMTEILEHVDDLKVLKNVPSGKRIILSVPSFMCDGHLRTYNEEIVKSRYADIMDIRFFMRFNWHDQKWVLDAGNTPSFILLVEAVKR